MSVIVVIGTLLSLFAVFGIIYPFKPFGRRRNAFVTLIASVVAVGVAVPEIKTEKGASSDAPSNSTEQINIPSDPKAKYFVTKMEALPNGIFEISTRREGSSGISFAIRQVKCKPLRFAYIAEGESETALIRNSSPKFSSLVDGSISDVIARYACSKRLVEELAVATRIATDPIVNQASAEKVVEKTTARRNSLEAETLASIEARMLEPAKVAFSSLVGEGLASRAFRDEIEARVIALVRPLPAGAREENLLGYEFLAQIRPENYEYIAKIDFYENAILVDKQREADKKELLKRRAISILLKKEDRVEGVTWYHHPNEPKFANSRSAVYLYIGRKADGPPLLRMRVQYTSTDWLFVNAVAAWHDGIKETLVSGSFERDNNSDIWEWIDIIPSKYQIEVLRSLVDSQETILRFTGDKYYKDVSFSANDRKSIKETLIAYEAMLEDRE